MSSTWQNLADQASVDIAAARDESTPVAEALEHLRDAWDNICNAINALEDEVEDV